ncbi:flagellar basal body P-ring formation chaperone FlgA [Stappia sp. MMSF_3263]|uniref:flagellar basal body P-ring formation chaperone FlgA n=1 Tax=Stappia sp. MMSF_3263 TaxID=3046693 RepID=UPI00273E890D|nr:flagellar basal body P-ring formation chaperone FlgA [Stappia sp. MMSF_3263]
MLRNSLLAAALLALSAAPLAAATLRSEVAVTGAVVTIGDFYPEAGRHAATPLFRAPDLGTRGAVSAHVIAERAQAAGFAEAGTDGLRQVMVERLALTIGEAEVEAAVRDALLLRETGLDADALQVSLSGFRGPIIADAGQGNPVSVETLDWDRASGRVSATLRVRAASRTQSVKLTGLAQEMIEVYTAIRPIERGTIVAEADLAPVRMPRNRLTLRQVADLGNIVGLAARRSIQAGRPLRAIDFEQPVLVKRGAKVTLVYQTAGMTLTTIGQAMSNGAKGDVIDILNLQSRRTVTGIVRAHDQIVVGTTRTRIAQLQETN